MKMKKRHIFFLSFFLILSFITCHSRSECDETSYAVGVYYYPGWSSYNSWVYLFDYPERKPSLGYYREGSPIIAQTHITWALNHGISFFVFDWYWEGGQVINESALHDGFMKAKNFDNISFSILWANHGDGCRDLERVTDYWIAHYLNKENYFRLDGRPLVFIFSPEKYVRDAGGIERAKILIRNFKARAIAAHCGEPLLIGCTSAPGEAKSYLEIGFDAFSGYNYPHAGIIPLLKSSYSYESMMEGYEKIWNEFALAHVPYIPIVEVGWDSRPWHGASALVRHGKTPHQFMSFLTKAKEFLDRDRTMSSGLSNVLIIEAWNEFGEGDYIEPTAEYGFTFLKAIRDVFAGKKAVRDNISVELDTVPVYQPPLESPTEKWDFVSYGGWDSGYHISTPHVDTSRREVSFRALSDDPILLGPCNRWDARDYQEVVIKMSVFSKDRKKTTGQFFWRDARDKGTFEEGKSIKFPVISDGRFHTYILDVSNSPEWNGGIKQFRLDPSCNNGDDIRVSYLEIKRK